MLRHKATMCDALAAVRIERVKCRMYMRNHTPYLFTRSNTESRLCELSAIDSFTATLCAVELDCGETVGKDGPVTHVCDDDDCSVGM